MPPYPVVLDSDWAQVLPETAEVSLIVTGGNGIADPMVLDRLARLLCAADSTGVTYSPL